MEKYICAQAKLGRLREVRALLAQARCVRTPLVMLRMARGSHTRLLRRSGTVVDIDSIEFLGSVGLT